jgi:hypothetical protein
MRPRSSRTSVVFWTTFANRSDPSAKSGVGHYEANLFVGCDMARSTSLDDLLASVVSALDQASRYQDVPMTLLWKTIGGRPHAREGMQLVFSVADELGAQEESMGACALKRIRVPVLPKRHPRNKMGFHVGRSHGCFTIAARHALERVPADAVLSILLEWKSVITSLVSR